MAWVCSDFLEEVFFGASRACVCLCLQAGWIYLWPISTVLNIYKSDVLSWFILMCLIVSAYYLADCISFMHLVKTRTTWTWNVTLQSLCEIDPKSACKKHLQWSKQGRGQSHWHLAFSFLKFLSGVIVAEKLIESARYFTWMTWDTDRPTQVQPWM